MKKIAKISAMLSLIAALIFLMTASGCKKSSSTTPARQTTYKLVAKDVLGVSGTVTFIETSSTSTTIDIVLTGATSGIHPAQLCVNSAIEGGSVVETLNSVDATGKSATLVTNMSYTQLIAYDGFIKVLLSSEQPNVIIAQGDIGGNVITTTNKTYQMTDAGSFGVSGTALFEKRVNGNTLVTISLTGTIPADEYPATINLGSITTIGGGPVEVTLNPVNGATGKGYTNIRHLDNGTVLTYDNWLVYDGYINIYKTTINIDDIICHGNIGSN